MKAIKTILILLTVCLVAVDIFASGDVVVSFNFYQGIRQKETTRPAVAASYYLKPLTGKGLIFDDRQKEEKVKLKRVYSLKDVKSLLAVKWRWKRGETTPRQRRIFLSGQEYRVRLTLKKRENGFRLEVIEKTAAESKNLLDTEMTLPLERRAIFGFEDALGKIYFLSFSREMESTGSGGGPIDIAEGEAPELIERVDPAYPPAAVEKLLEDTVLLAVVVDKKGNISEVKVTGGRHEILKEAAITAVKQWKYRPYIKDGIAREIKFTIVLDFYFN